MNESGKQSSPKMRDFIEYNEKGEPIVLSSNVGNGALHPGIKDDGDLAVATPGGSKQPSTPRLALSLSKGSMRFFCDISRLTSPLRTKLADA